MSAAGLMEQVRNAAGASSAHQLDLALTEARRRYGDRFDVVEVRVTTGGRVQYVVEAR